MATSSLVIYSKPQKQKACPSWPSTSESTSPWLQTTQLFPKLSPGEDYHSSGTCWVHRLVAAKPGFCGACPASDLGLCLKKSAKRLCSLKCRAKRQQPHTVLRQGLSPTFPLSSGSHDHAAHSQAGHGNAHSFGGSVEDWQQRPIHNIFIFFPILAHRPQQEVPLLSNTLSKAPHLFLPIWHRSTFYL